VELILGGLQDSYVRLVRHVRDNGVPVKCRDQMTFEITAASLIFPDVTMPLLPIGVNRGINLKLAAVEALQLIAGESCPELVTAAAPEFTRVLVDASDLDHAAYGPRTQAQLNEIITMLKHDPTSRQAVAMIWRRDDLTFDGDKPCTIFLQFLIRNEKLELHTHMRSNDVWLGVPYDVFAFTQLQQSVARALHRQVGQYVHHATSLHLYERDLERAAKLQMTDPDAGEPPLPHGIRYRHGDFPSDWLPIRALASNILHGEFSTDLNGWYVSQMRKVLT